MLVVNRYENRQTGKVTIQAHVVRGKQVLKSYAPCCSSLIDMIAQNYSFYLLCDVDYYSKLKTVNIVNAWKWKGFKMNIKELSSKIEQLKENINHAKWMYFNADLGSDMETKHCSDLNEYRHQLDKLLETKLGDLIGYEHENN